jgi:hypothetical protein
MLTILPLNARPPPAPVEQNESAGDAIMSSANRSITSATATDAHGGRFSLPRP